MDETSVWQVVAVCVSAVAAVFTAWMAYETRKMARSTSKTLDLEKMPILGLRDVKVETIGRMATDDGSQERVTRGLSHIRFGIELYNAGRVTVRYKVNSLVVSFAGKSPESKNYLSRGGRVLPGGSTVFWHSGLHLEPPIETFPNKGRVAIEFEYADESGRDPKLLVETVEVTLSTSEEGFRFGWLHVDEVAEA